MSSISDVLSVIRQNAFQQRVPANTWLYQQGDLLRDLYLLEKGLIKMTHIEANGNEVIVELRFPGSFLGAASVMANTPAPLAAFTITDCDVARLSVKDFLQLEQTDSIFSHELLVFISQQKGEQSIRQGNQKASPARMRLAQLLLLLSHHFGVERSGEMRLASPLSKQDMAGWVGIEPQSLSVIMREMKRDGLIAEVKDWLILCDLQRLTNEAEIGETTSLPPRLSKGGGGQKSKP